MNQGIIRIQTGRTSILLPLSPTFLFRYHFQLHHNPCHYWKAAACFQNPHRQKGRGRKSEERKEEGIECHRDRGEKIGNEKKDSWSYGKSWKEEKEWQD